LILSLILKKDPTASKSWHVFLFSAVFHGLLLYRISRLFWNSELRFMARVLHYVGRVLYSIDIYPAARLEGGVVIDHDVGVVVGSTTSVGRGTLIYHGVTLGSKNVLKGWRHPDVGKSVILGAGAKVLKPKYVCDNARVGVNSVVLSMLLKILRQQGYPQEFIRLRRVWRLSQNGVS